jgi:hypothetical protein
MDIDEILLKEYEICHEDCNALGSRFWSFANIFIPTNLALLGLLLSIMLNKPDISNIRFIILIVGPAAIGILIFVLRWLKRVNALNRFNYDRAREIEIQLGMWKNRRLNAIDNFENNKFKTDKIRPDTTSILLIYHNLEWWRNKKNPFLNPFIGSTSVCAIFIILMILWFILFIYGIIYGFIIPIHHHPCNIPPGF